MTARHVGRFGHRGFILRHGASSAAGMVIGVPGGYWEIEYESEIYPWRPVRPVDERDMPQLMRTAVAYLQAELQRRP